MRNIDNKQSDCKIWLILYVKENCSEIFLFGDYSQPINAN